jgi:hypothetical protein
MSVGDVNSDDKGSGARYISGKVDFSLLPLCTLEDECRVWEYGKRKYAAWNWAKGMPWSVAFACMMRHMSAWQRGEENDQESGLPHIAHAMCNLRMLTLYAKTYTEGDDRPVKWMPKSDIPPSHPHPIHQINQKLPCEFGVWDRDPDESRWHCSRCGKYSDEHER